MSTSIAHLETEQRFWSHYVEPLASKNHLKWDVQMNILSGTVTLKLVHGVDVPVVSKNPDLVSIINVDRKLRSEERIKNEIHKAIALRTHGK